MNRIRRKVIAISIAAGVLAGCLLFRNEQKARDDCVATQNRYHTELEVPPGIQISLDRTSGAPIQFHFQEER
jgi:uncharacterized lipoprotein